MYQMCPYVSPPETTRLSIDRIVREGLLAAFAAMSLLLAGNARAADDGECVGKPSDTRAYVTVDNVRSNVGLIAITLYPDDKSRFLQHKGSLYVGRVPAQAPSTSICFLIPEPGYYGIAIYHDENANKQIDRAGLLPSEGYGFSNDAPVFFGLHTYSSDRIRLAADANNRIPKHYLNEEQHKQAEAYVKQGSN